MSAPSRILLRRDADDRDVFHLYVRVKCTPSTTNGNRSYLIQRVASVRDEHLSLMFGQAGEAILQAIDDGRAEPCEFATIQVLADLSNYAGMERPGYSQESEREEARRFVMGR